jgi:hypothetical protein
VCSVKKNVRFSCYKDYFVNSMNSDAANIVYNILTNAQCSSFLYGQVAPQTEHSKTLTHH